MYKPISHLNKWKAKEMKSFSYLILPLFYNFLSKKQVKMLNNFRRVQYMLSNRRLTSQDLKRLKDIEENFINSYIGEMGNYAVTQKVHRVSHYHKSVENLGTSNNFSCFPMEGYLSFLSNGTHSTSQNLNELYFLSMVNTYVPSYITNCEASDLFVQGEQKGKKVRMNDVEWILKDVNENDSFNELLNEDEGTRYNNKLGMNRENCHIAFKYVPVDSSKECIAYGTIQEFLLGDEGVEVIVQRYKVVKDSQMKLDDLFIESEAEVVCISPNDIVCKFVTLDYDETYKWIICSVNDQFY